MSWNAIANVNQATPYQRRFLAHPRGQASGMREKTGPLAHPLSQRTRVARPAKARVKLLLTVKYQAHRYSWNGKGIDIWSSRSGLPGMRTK